MNPRIAFLALVVSIAHATGDAGQTVGKSQPSAEIKQMLEAADKLAPDARPKAGQQAAAHAHEIGDKVGEDRAIIATGYWLTAISQYAPAIDAIQQGIRLAEANSDVDGQGVGQMDLGNAFLGAGRFQEALDAYGTALDLRRQIGDELGEGRLLADAGLAQVRLNQPQKALDAFRSALAIQTKVNDLFGEERDLTFMGETLDGLDNLTDAAEALNRALPIATQLKDLAGEATDLGYLGATYQALHRPDDALAALKKAEPIEKALGDMDSLGRTMHLEAEVDEVSGRPVEALAEYKAILPITRQRGDRPAEAEIYEDIGNIYGDLGQLESAWFQYEQALTIRKALGDQKGEAAIFNDVGQIYENAGQYNRGLNYYQQALLVEKAMGDGFLIGITLDDIGNSYDDMGESDHAISSLKEALKFETAAKARSEVGIILNDLGAVYGNLDADQAALDDYLQALAIERAYDDSTNVALTLDNIAECMEGLHQVPLAIMYAKQAVNYYQKVRSDVKGLGRDVAASYTKTIQFTYQHLADLYAQEGDIANSERVMDFLKDEEYGQLRRDAAVSPTEKVELTSLESKWFAKYQAIADNEVKLRARQEELEALDSLTPAQTTEYHQISDQLDQASTAFKEYAAGLTAAFADVHDDVADLAEDSDFQSAFAPDGDVRPAAIYTLVTSDGVRLILSVDGMQKPYTIKTPIKAKDLYAKIVRFRKVLTSDQYDPTDAAADLYDILVRPIEADLRTLKVNSLAWYLNGALRYIPMGALYDRDSKQYLIEKYPTGVFTKASKTKLSLPRMEWTKAVAFGNSEGGVSTDAVTGASLNFAPLPGVQSELAAVKAELGGATYLNADFTAEAMEDGLRTKPQAVHIATHFYLVGGDDFMQRSCLLLGSDKTMSLEQFSKLQQGRFNTDIVVLSACQTAVSEDASGAEVESLSRSIEELGAHSVLASLWSVSDVGTSALMSEFYRARREHPEWTKLKALQQAQLSLLHGDAKGAAAPASRAVSQNAPKEISGEKPYVPNPARPLAHPFYWAPFVLYGNWK